MNSDDSGIAAITNLSRLNEDLSSYSVILTLHNNLSRVVPLIFKFLIGTIDMIG